MYFHLTSSMVDKQVHAKLKTFPSFMSYLRNILNMAVLPDCTQNKSMKNNSMKLSRAVN